MSKKTDACFRGRSEAALERVRAMLTQAMATNSRLGLRGTITTRRRSCQDQITDTAAAEQRLRQPSCSGLGAQEWTSVQAHPSSPGQQVGRGKGMTRLRTAGPGGAVFAYRGGKHMYLHLAAIAPALRERQKGAPGSQVRHSSKPLPQHSGSGGGRALEQPHLAATAPAFGVW